MMWVIPKGRSYYAELKGDSSVCIRWNHNQTKYWLFVKSEPIAGTFSSKEEAKEYYEKSLKN